MQLLDRRWAPFIAVVAAIILALLVYFWNIREKALKQVFSQEEAEKYGAIEKTFAVRFMFYRYILFRNQLNELQIQPESLDNLKLLFDLQGKTWGAYVAQHYFVVCTAAVVAAIIGASAAEWSFGAVVGSVIALALLYAFFYVFSTEYRRQFEISRFLAWYKADSANSASTAANDGSADQQPKKEAP